MAEDEEPLPQKPPSLISLAIRTGGRMPIRPIGLPRLVSQDIYHNLMRFSWPKLAAMFGGGFILFNLFFAALYSLDQQGLSVAHEAGSEPLFWRDFFFSVHTVATIGYGNVYPVSIYDNALVVVEIIFGLMGFALATGIAFARFSRPTARILFSHVLVVRDVDGVPTLMLRAANQRHNMIYSAEVSLALIADSEVGGTKMRRFFDLPVVRKQNPTFTLTWLVMHPIDSASPLRHWVEDPGNAAGDEIIVILSGFDEISGQTIYDRWAYTSHDIRWDSRFVDIVATEADGTRSIDYRRFHEIESA
jgi:inward rectifier potassium channel